MIRKLLGYARSRFSDPVGPLWRNDGGLITTVKHGELKLAERVHFYPNCKLSVLGTKELPATLEIGERTTIGENSHIHACRSIVIGSGCMIAWNVSILENNFHAPSNGPIRIGKNVWIGCYAVVLSGVTIGDGARIAAGAIVLDDVPAGAMVASPKAVIKGLVS